MTAATFPTTAMTVLAGSRCASAPPLGRDLRLAIGREPLAITTEDFHDDDDPMRTDRGTQSGCTHD